MYMWIILLNLRFSNSKYVGKRPTTKSDKSFINIYGVTVSGTNVSTIMFEPKFSLVIVVRIVS